MAGSSSAVSGVRADLTVNRAPRPQSLLQQLDWFAGRIADLTTENDNLRKDLTTISQRQEEADTFTRHELEQMDHEFRSKLTNLAAGGLQIQTWGVCFLIVGTLLTVWGSALR
jgi:TolA-binding protein